EGAEDVRALTEVLRGGGGVHAETGDLLQRGDLEVLDLVQLLDVVPTEEIDDPVGLDLVEVQFLTEPGQLELIGVGVESTGQADEGVGGRIAPTARPGQRRTEFVGRLGIGVTATHRECELDAGSGDRGRAARIVQTGQVDRFGVVVPVAVEVLGDLQCLGTLFEVLIQRAGLPTTSHTPTEENDTTAVFYADHLHRQRRVTLYFGIGLVASASWHSQNRILEPAGQFDQVVLAVQRNGDGIHLLAGDTHLHRFRQHHGDARTGRLAAVDDRVDLVAVLGHRGRTVRVVADLDEVSDHLVVEQIGDAIESAEPVQAAERRVGARHPDAAGHGHAHAGGRGDGDQAGPRPATGAALSGAPCGPVLPCCHLTTSLSMCVTTYIRTSVRLVTPP